MPFLRLLDVNGKVLFLGASARAMTFYHGLEELLETELPVAPFTPEVFELQTRDSRRQAVDDADAAVFTGRRDTKLLVPVLKSAGPGTSSAWGYCRWPPPGVTISSMPADNSHGSENPSIRQLETPTHRFTFVAS